MINPAIPNILGLSPTVEINDRILINKPKYENFVQYLNLIYDYTKYYI